MNEWSKLRPLSKLDQLAECIIKASFIMSQEYKVLPAHMNQDGCNFSVQNNEGEIFDIICRQINLEKTTYSYISKSHLVKGLHSNILIGLVIFIDKQKPYKYLFSSTIWQNPNKLFTDSGLKHPEYGINITKNNFAELAKYTWDIQTI